MLLSQVATIFFGRRQLFFMAALVVSLTYTVGSILSHQLLALSRKKINYYKFTADL